MQGVYDKSKKKTETKRDKKIKLRITLITNTFERSNFQSFLYSMFK